MAKKNRKLHKPEGRAETIHCRIAASQRGTINVFLVLPQARKYFDSSSNTCVTVCKHACKPKGK